MQIALPHLTASHEPNSPNGPQGSAIIPLLEMIVLLVLTMNGCEYRVRKLKGTNTGPDAVAVLNKKN